MIGYIGYDLVRSYARANTRVTSRVVDSANSEAVSVLTAVTVFIAIWGGIINMVIKWDLNVQVWIDGMVWTAAAVMCVGVAVLCVTAIVVALLWVGLFLYVPCYIIYLGVDAIVQKVRN